MSLNEFPLILVYYRFRGLLQPIRNLYCYLELPFIELQLDHIEDQKKFLSPVIIQHISKLKIDKNQLPVLIHGNLVVEGVYPVVVYSCKKFNGEALMGSSIFIRVIIDLFRRNYKKSCKFTSWSNRKCWTLSSPWLRSQPQKIHRSPTNKPKDSIKTPSKSQNSWKKSVNTLTSNKIKAISFENSL